MNFDSPINVLIPDGERVLAKFVVNCLSNCKDVDVHVLSRNKNASIKYSRFIASYTFENQYGYDENWIEFIKTQITLNKINVIMPVEIEDIRLLSAHSDDINELATLLVPPLNSFDSTLDKWKFYKFLISNKLPSPISLDCLEPVKQNQFPLDFPLLLKPKIGMGGFGIKTILDANMLKEGFNTNKDYMAQEMIDGYDIDMSVLCLKGTILAYTIQKGYVFSTCKYSAALSVEFLYEDDIYSSVSKMMKNLNWTGFAHVDLRYDKMDGTFKILEINPRAWGSIEASKSVGINFPYLYILTSMGIAYDQPAYSFDTCSGNKGLIRIMKSKLSNKKKSFSIAKHNYQLKHFTDPLPLIKDYFNSKNNRS
ncbi:ATP-grasp domain-containing protein [Lutimonas halocynthiae]|uniref:ATP-grasp domain-containing protein n=1 Tax=Lutimonas halocynthiae TaxID=1446477 RepID=UPI0025B54770|nr:ATP-grasp domain-containing protein [Lutimonas halocynthiae]MDN3644278.1 ATP-grasp domain-containing protein [Lutimonas halocynthiae]